MLFRSNQQVIVDCQVSMRTNANRFVESVLILGDQLSPYHSLLEPARRHERVVVMVESLNRMRSRRYHKQKVLLVLSALRYVLIEVDLLVAWLLIPAYSPFAQSNVTDDILILIAYAQNIRMTAM